MHNINICFVIGGIKCSSFSCRSKFSVLSAGPDNSHCVSSISGEMHLLLSESLATVTDTVCTNTRVILSAIYNLSQDQVSETYPTITAKVKNPHLIKVV